MTKSEPISYVSCVVIRTEFRSPPIARVLREDVCQYIMPRRAASRAKGAHEVLSAFKMTLPASFVYATLARAASLLPT